MANDLPTDESKEDGIMSESDGSVNFSGNESEDEFTHENDLVDGMIKEKDYQEHLHIPPHLDDDQKETANDDFN